MSGPAGSAGSPGGPARISIDLPEGWHRVTGEDAVPLLARPQRWARRFVPTVTVVVSRTPGVMALGDYTDAQLAGVRASFGGHLVHLDAVHRPGPHLDLVLATEQMGVDLTVAQRHVLGPADDDGSDRTSVVATALALDGDWAHLAGALLSTVRSVDVTWA